MGQVMCFIDNMLVGTKGEKGYNELVEEVLIRIKVNYLYVKSTKCKWKVKEVGFLEVVIRCQVQFTLEVKVCKMDLEMCRLVEQPWLHLMCCATCLLYGCNFR